jgi:hypothetical protein
MNNKTIIITRGGSSNIITTSCGDLYDSMLDVMDDIGNNLLHLDHISTIPSKLLFGKDQLSLHGIIKEGNYGAIFCNNSTLGNHFCLFQSQYFDQIKTRDDVNDNMIIFPSLIPNPSNNNGMFINSVNLHIGGKESNYSEGCITVYPDDFTKLNNMFNINDKIKIIILRSPEWIIPTNL